MKKLILNCDHVLNDIKKYDDYFFNILFADPPYNLGSEIIIDESGKMKFKGTAKDFMNKWKFGSDEWEKFMTESFRDLKYGGFCLLFGMDRQLALVQYYALKAGFENIFACEISKSWIDTANARINFWKDHDLEKEITESEEIPGQGSLF